MILYLDPKAGPPERLLADMKCHRAWMMLTDAGMDDCPLDLPGIQLDAQQHIDYEPLPDHPRPDEAEPDATDSSSSR